MFDPKLPVYDVTGVCFCRDVCNFTLANVLSALRSVGIKERMKLFATVPVTVYDQLLVSGQLDEYPDKIMWGRFEVTIDQEADVTGNVCDSLLSDGKRKVVLRTREY